VKALILSSYQGGGYVSEKNSREKIDFSRLAKNLPIRIAESSTVSRFNFDKAAITRALNNKNIPELRAISNYFWTVSGEYRRLVMYMASMLTFEHVLFPRVPEEMLSNSAFENALEEAKLYLYNSAIKQTSYDIMLSVIKDGAYFGYEREVNGQYIFQPLSPNFCRSHYKINNNFVIEFDFAFFDSDRDGTLLEQFPPEFKKMKAAYDKDKQLNKWQILDPTFTRAHILHDGVPIFSAVFIELLELEDYKQIEKKKARLATYKPIIQKLPTDADGMVTVLIEEGEELHNNFLKMIDNPDVDVITTPCEVSSIDLWDSKETVADEIEKAKNVIYSTAGTPLVLFNAGSKNSSVGLRASLQVDEAALGSILAQFEDWYAARMLRINAVFNFAVLFPLLTIFNKDEKFKLYKDGASAGYPSKLLALSALGINSYDNDYLLNFENTFLKLVDRMTPTQSSYTLPGENGAGAPSKTGELTEEGQKTKDQEKNKKTKGE